MNTKYQGLQRARAYGMSRTFARISETQTKVKELTKTLVISGIVSIDHVQCQSKSITIYHDAYAVDTLKVGIEAVKGRKMSFSHSHHNLLRVFVRWLSPQY